MKSHDAAKHLEEIARLLRSLPNIPLGALGAEKPVSALASSPEALAVNLGTLASLSRVERAQWISLIEEHGFPIELRPRDASRDVLGKLLRFLEQNPRAIRQLQQRGRDTGAAASPELLRALDTLLKDS
jgi:hypothetical protein